MAQVRFYPVRIRFQTLRDLLVKYDATQFKYLVFQSENLDSTHRRDEYDLTGFVVDPNWKAALAIGNPDIIRDLDNQPHKVNDKRVAFGNYPLTRTKIEEIKNGTGGPLIDYLLLKPKEYSRDPRYISYQIVAVNTIPFNNTDNIENYKILTEGDEDLNPCPPNQPSQG